MDTVIEEDGMFFASVLTKYGIEKRGFMDRFTAMTWMKYKQNLNGEMDAFNFPKTELMTFEDALELKIKAMSEENKDLRDFNVLRDVFKDFLPREFASITYEELLDFAKELAKMPIYRGGAGDKMTGSKRLPSKRTVIKRFVLLGTIYSYMNEIGVPIVNYAHKVCAWLRENMKE